MLAQESDHLKNVVSDVLARARSLGIDGAEVSLARERGLSLTLRLSELDTVAFNQDQTLSITVYQGQQKGTASTTDLDSKAIEACLEAARSISQQIEADPFAALVEPQYLAKQWVDCDLYHPWSPSVAEAQVLTQQCEEAARAVDARIVNSEGATFSSQDHYQVYGNTHGFLGAYPSTSYSLSAGVVAKEGDAMERDFDFTVARDPKDLASSQHVGQTAGRKTVERLHARKIKTTQAPVIFSAEVSSSLVSHLLGALSGMNLYRKTSFLVDHLDQAIFPSFVQLQAIPHRLKGLGSAPFDAEGVATQERFLIEAGILRGYILGSYSARRLGLKTTGNAGGVQNVLFSQTRPALDQTALLQAMGRGFLVTELIGQGVNPVTGDYSRGAFGFWVEHGEIQYPVHELTLSGNLKQMYQGVVAVGSDVDGRSPILSPSIWIDRMMLAGL